MVPLKWWTSAVVAALTAPCPAAAGNEFPFLPSATFTVTKMEVSTEITTCPWVAGDDVLPPCDCISSSSLLLTLPIHKTADVWNTKTDKDKLVSSNLMTSQINEITSDWLMLCSSVQPVCKESKSRWLVPSPPEAPRAKEQGYLGMEHVLLKCSGLF